MLIYTTRAIIENDSKILLGLRQNSDCFNNYYGLIGGRVEKNESIADALIRKVYDEINISITKANLNFVHCLSFKNEKLEDVLVLVFKIINWSGQPINKKIDKYKNITWFKPNTLPSNIIPHHHHIIKMIESNISYSEKGWLYHSS